LPVEGRTIPQALDLTDLRSGAIVTTLTQKMHGAELRSASADGRVWLFDASTYDGYRLLKVDLQTRTSQALGVSNLVKPGYSWTCQLSPDGNLLAAECEDNTLALWDTNKNSLVARVRKTNAPYSFSAKGKSLVGFGKSEIVVLDLTSMTKRTEVPTPPKFYPQSVVPLAITDDGTYVAGVFYYVPVPLQLDANRFLMCWEVSSGKEILREELLPEPISMSGPGYETSVRFSAGGRSLLVLTDSRQPQRLKCFDMRTRQFLSGSFTTEQCDWSLSPDGRVLAACMQNWDQKESALFSFLHRFGLNLPQPSSSGIVFHDPVTGDNLSEKYGLGGPSLDSGIPAEWSFPVWSPDGCTVVTLDRHWGHALTLWDVPPRKPLTWFAAGAALLALPISLLAWRRTRKLRAA
jgi:WD40 repeat protein